jgi:predicted neutral ceramidase superfamily lipid hydrolase
MKNCPHCKVGIRGDHTVCPLCAGILEDKGEPSEDVFPHIPTIYQEFNIFIRVLIMISIVGVVASFAVNLIFTKESLWSLLVAAGVASMWISLFFIIRNRNNIAKTILWQVGIISILSFLWDRSMGWYGWSLNYVIPTTCVLAMIVMAVGAKILKIGVRDLIIYLLIDAIFGFIPAVFIIFDWVNVLFPSVICVGVSIISLSALILFEGDNMKTELKKRMHI